MVGTIPLSLVIPTINRAAALRRTLESVRDQSLHPAEIIIVDASRDIAQPSLPGLRSDMVYARAEMAGAASQRNQGVAMAQHPVIGFFDDDILLEQDCIARLWSALQSDPRIGGVNAMITNQRYTPPGAVSRVIFAIMAGGPRASYAGALLGPAINLLPEDNNALPDIVPVEWLNTTCTLYRREALPSPVFPDFFTGYSMMEDAALSFAVGRNWKLANARTARIFHDSQPGSHKDDCAALARMELVNRHYVMTRVMERRGIRNHAKLLVWEIFQLSAFAVRNGPGRAFWKRLWGKLQGLWQIAKA